MFRRCILWIGCTGLALVLVAAEELADGASGLVGQRMPIAQSSKIPRTDGETSETLTNTGNGNVFADKSTSASDNALGKKIYRICRVTAYCDRGTTAAGIAAGVGQCAAPADIPFGSTIYIPALNQTFVVTDRTHRRFRRSTVDLFIPSKKRCRTFGRRYLECEFTVPDQPPTYGKVRVPASISQAHFPQ